MPYWLKYRGTRFPVRPGETTVGRSPYSTIVVGCSLASRSHARLRCTEEELLIADAGSANGTSVNGTPLTGRLLLAAGDIIRIGTDILEVESAPAQSKVQTLKPPPPADDDDLEVIEGFETETGVHTLDVDFAEGMMLAAKQSADPCVMATDVRKSVDGVIAAMEEGHQPCGRADAARLVAIAETTAEWAPDGELEEWRGTVLARLSMLREDQDKVTRHPPPR
ncbi:MAG: FHA domain-containing protein [Deltaproteobacteria bacterium]|nr:FHA domain-containing protein [Deltaproteobacteria bacterium]